MVSALFYLQWHSVFNRTRSRLKRLKEPKYFLGALVGGLYFYWYFFRPMFGAGGVPWGNQATWAEDLELYRNLGALVLLVIVTLGWVIPRERAALAFTEAEVAFLFPAPISRKGLIHYKLLRSQASILFTTLLLTLVANRWGGGGWMRVAGWWVLLSTLSLHFLGSSFARTILADRGLTPWPRRLLVLALVLAGAGAVAAWGWNTMPAFDLSTGESLLSATKRYADHFLNSGPAPYLLAPFRVALGPCLAPDGMGFARALGPALLLLGLHYWWVVRSDVAFEEASVEASRKLAEKLSAIRSGAWGSNGQKSKARRPPFELRPRGFPAIALTWKNLIGAGSVVNARFWIILGAMGVGVFVVLGQRGTGPSWLALVAMLSAMLLIWSFLLGPQFLRQDFRQDLPVLGLLKTFPLSGWQIAFGQLLAPAIILTAIQWLLLPGVFLPLALDHRPHSAWPDALAGAVGCVLLLPGLNFISLQIPNAAVLLFPAWFSAAKDGAQGIEATGQRLIFMMGQLVVMVLALVPAGALFALALFVIPVRPVALLAGLGLAAAVLAIEAAGGFWLLGRLFERFDLSRENPG
jgi:hypothetical protein